VSVLVLPDHLRLFESFVMRCSRSAVGVRSVMYSAPSDGSMHSPPPPPMPDSAVVVGA
jgi:hypothetical protein